MPKLLLFDIDGTLLTSDSNVVHVDAFAYAIKELLGIDTNVKGINYHGKIDSQILIESLVQKGIKKEAAEIYLSELFPLMVGYVNKHLGDLQEHLLPNVVTCLQEISKRTDIIIGLLTGNVEGIAWLKMEKAGIKDYFKLGAFGNEAHKRSDLVSIAMEKAPGVSINDVTLIGDTPLDIKCAQEAGCKVIAVSSGKFTQSELEKYEPDFLVKDIIEVVRLLGNSSDKEK
jgi:phosphoglycolate phosphatase